MYKENPCHDEILNKNIILISESKNEPKNIYDILENAITKDESDFIQILDELVYKINYGEAFYCSSNPFEMLFNYIDKKDNYDCILSFFMFIAVFLFHNIHTYYLIPEMMTYLLNLACIGPEITYLAFVILLNYSYCLDKRGFSKAWHYTYFIIDCLDNEELKDVHGIAMKVCINIMDRINQDDLTGLHKVLSTHSYNILDRNVVEFLAFSLQNEEIYKCFSDKIFKTISLCNYSEFNNSIYFWRTMQKYHSQYKVLMHYNIFPKYFLLLYDSQELLDTSKPNAMFLHIVFSEINYFEANNLSMLFHASFIKFLNECIVSDILELRDISIKVFASFINSLHINDIRYLVTDETINWIFKYTSQQDDDELSADITLQALILTIFQTYISIIEKNPCSCMQDSVYDQISVNYCVEIFNDIDILEIIDVFDASYKEVAIEYWCSIDSYIDQIVSDSVAPAIPEPSCELDNEEKEALNLYGNEYSD